MITTQRVRTHARTRAFNGPFPGLPRSAGTRKVKPIWILLKQKTVSGSGISWAIYKSAPCSRQTTTPAPHHSVFYRPDAFLTPNQQRQSTEGTTQRSAHKYHVQFSTLLQSPELVGGGWVSLSKNPTRAVGHLSLWKYKACASQYTGLDLRMGLTDEEDSTQHVLLRLSPAHYAPL